MTITYLGHSCFHILTNGISLVTDPYIKGNKLAADIAIEDITCDYVLVSHGHVDHLADAELFLKREGVTLIANFEITAWFENKGYSGLGMNIGGAVNFGFGKLRMVNAVHSSVLPDGKYGGSAAGFIIESENVLLYFAGDTALTWDMKIIPLSYGQPKMAILPIGGHFTMDVSDAVMAADFIGCDTIIGCHYDTFEPIQIDKNAATEKFNAAEKELILLPVGHHIDIN
ncbi:MAG: metal-dependent hydrolase [Saprospiraceae bacterium]|nr:metal-dependent hydrolase [Saprospiraceae bacterium]